VKKYYWDKKDKYYWTKKTNIIGQMTGTDPDHKLDVCFSIDVIP